MVVLIGVVSEKHKKHNMELKNLKLSDLTPAEYNPRANFC